MTDDTLALLVWAKVAQDTLDLDDDPEAVIARIRGHHYTPTTLAEEIGLHWPVRRELLEAAAWAGKARWALTQRDKAVRFAVSEGCPKRSVAQAVGLSSPAIDRILAREGVGGTRW